MFDSTITIESKVEPGVSFVVRRLNFIERAKRDFSIVEARCRVSELAEQAEAFAETVEVDGKSEKRTIAGKERDVEKLAAEKNLVYSTEIVPAYIRTGLISVAGMDIGDQSAADAVLACPSDDFITEVHMACYAASDLSEEQRKNWQSPTTSLEAAGGQASSSTAPSASE